MIYQMMFYGGIVASTLLLLLLVLLFWKSGIYQIVCNLSGITAKRTIHRIEQTGSADLPKEKKKSVRVRSGETTQKLSPAEKTAEETTVLAVGETTILESETTLLQGETAFVMMTDIMEIHSEEVIL